MKSQILKLVLLLILSLPLLIPQEIYSQEKPMWYGVKGGWNYTFTNVEIANGQVQGKSGFQGGAVFEYWFSDLFALQANALYNTKGGKWEVEGGFLWWDTTYKYTWSFDYLSIPISAKIAFGSTVKFYLIAGPEFSFLLSGEEIKEVEGAEETTDLKEDMSSFELAANFGFGLDIHIKPIVLFFEVRGSLGLTDVFKDGPTGDIQVPEDEAVKNIVPTISFGILF